jgi:hypothetical protein
MGFRSREMVLLSIDMLRNGRMLPFVKAKYDRWQNQKHFPKSRGTGLQIQSEYPSLLQLPRWLCELPLSVESQEWNFADKPYH